MTDFELIDNPSTEAVIKVVGVGGCGCNAIDHMLSKGIEGVDFIATNTDAQALQRNKAQTQIQLGTSITKGLGAGQASDLKWIESCARQIAKYANGHTIVVEKSTLPVKTAQTIKSILEAYTSKGDSDYHESKCFSILSNPEFLADRKAISCQIVTDKSASLESGLYRHPPCWAWFFCTFCDLKIRSIAF